MSEASVYSVVELIGSSSDSWEDAARNAARRLRDRAAAVEGLEAGGPGIGAVEG